jgi:hypothetical protein
MRTKDEEKERERDIGTESLTERDRQTERERQTKRQ